MIPFVGHVKTDKTIDMEYRLVAAGDKGRTGVETENIKRLPKILWLWTSFIS